LVVLHHVLHVGSIKHGGVRDIQVLSLASCISSWFVRV
jgi:hypothetical protein